MDPTVAYVVLGKKGGFSNLSRVLGGILRVTSLQGKISKLEEIGATGRGPEPIVINGVKCGASL